jgi:hypothetical protein
MVEPVRDYGCASNGVLDSSSSDRFHRTSKIDVMRSDNGHEREVSTHDQRSA